MLSCDLSQRSVKLSKVSVIVSNVQLPTMAYTVSCSLCSLQHVLLSQQSWFQHTLWTVAILYSLYSLVCLVSFDGRSHQSHTHINMHAYIHYWSKLWNNIRFVNISEGSLWKLKTQLFYYRNKLHQICIKFKSI